MAPDGVGVVRVSSSIDRSVDCEVYPEDNEAVVTVSRGISVDTLFDTDGELRLWEDYAGWSGFLRDDDAFWRVNYQSERDEFLSKELVDAEAVAGAVADHSGSRRKPTPSGWVADSTTRWCVVLPRVRGERGAHGLQRLRPLPTRPTPDTDCVVSRHAQYTREGV